ncbi:hypothetical protein [Planomicrobium sp. CPCC 101110]|nr:hypothetical protein [Planomicrobium sp. CPCC 101110]
MKKLLALPFSLNLLTACSSPGMTKQSPAGGNPDQETTAPSAGTHRQRPK